MDYSRKITLLTFPMISKTLSKDKKRQPFAWGILTSIFIFSVEPVGAGYGIPSPAQKPIYSQNQTVSQEGEAKMKTILEALKDLGHSLKEGAQEKAEQFEDKAKDIYHKLGEYMTTLEEATKEKAHDLYEEGQKLMADLKNASADKKEAARKKVAENLEAITEKLKDHPNEKHASDKKTITQALKDLGKSVKEVAGEKKDAFAGKAADLYADFQKKIDKLDDKTKKKMQVLYKEGQTHMADLKAAAADKKEAIRKKVVKNLEDLDKQLQ